MQESQSWEQLLYTQISVTLIRTLNPKDLAKVLISAKYIKVPTIFPQFLIFDGHREHLFTSAPLSLTMAVQQLAYIFGWRENPVIYEECSQPSYASPSTTI